MGFKSVKKTFKSDINSKVYFYQLQSEDGRRLLLNVNQSCNEYKK